jgi:hypothetical protein
MQAAYGYNLHLFALKMKPRLFRKSEFIRKMLWQGINTLSINSMNKNPICKLRFDHTICSSTTLQSEWAYPFFEY